MLEADFSLWRWEFFLEGGEHLFDEEDPDRVGFKQPAPGTVENAAVFMPTHACEHIVEAGMEGQGPIPAALRPARRSKKPAPLAGPVICQADRPRLHVDVGPSQAS